MSEKKDPTPEVTERNLAVGARIKTLRLQKGYTQSQLGPKIGLSANAAAQWESGLALPKYDNLEALAGVLDTTTEWLMTGNHPEELERVQTTTERRVLSLIRSIPSTEHARVMAILQAFADKENP